MKIGKPFFIFAIFWCIVAGGAAFYSQRPWLFLFCLTPGFLLYHGIRFARLRCREEWLLWAGLAFTLMGDYFLVYCGYGRHSTGFLGGVTGFSLTQACFIAYFARHKGLYKAVAGGCFLIALTVLLTAYREISLLLFVVLLGYGALSAISFSGALKSGNRWFAIGVGLLFVSDITIALNWVLTVNINSITAITYLAAILSFAFALAGCGRKIKPLAEC